MNKQTTIGIVGGGQLGKMLTVAAKQMGMRVVVTDPTPESPAGQVADKQLIGGYKDEKTTQELAKQVDVVTVDAEFVNDEVLSEIVKRGTPVHPSPKTIRIIKDKLQQKMFLKKHKIPTASFLEVTTYEDIEHAAKIFGYPLLLKARFDAYDGKGNALIKNKAGIKAGLEKLKNRQLYVEKYIPFTKELAVMVARSTKGEIVSYPVVETKHVNNVCDTVSAPAAISKKAYKRAQKLAGAVMQRMTGAGVFGIEMFLTKSDTVLVNEIAPRVHNSGHYTIEACVTSQFEQHIRAISGLPLGSVEMLPQAVVMKNILGTRDGDAFPKGIEKALMIPNVSLHLYGKKESRIGRKMGHITVTGKTVAECLRKANKARRTLVI